MDVTALPCPNCGTDLTFLDQYQRHFCYACQQYAPEGYGAHGPKICPTCGSVLSYVAAYDRFFCYRCQAYAPIEGVVTEPPKTRAPEPTGPVSPAVPLVAEAGPAETPTEPSERQAEAAAPEKEEYVVVERPPLTRELIETAKKSVLLDLCQAYELDAAGTKEQLKERLLSYLEEQEASARAAEEAPPEEGGGEEAPAVVVEPAPLRARGSEARTAAQAVVVEEAPSPVPEAAAIEAAPTPAVEAAAVPTEAAAKPIAAEHPCPQCGRELDYIAQYDRWYCHFCKAYAPKRQFKHACPTCGATLRWIERYQRWWCDAEQQYAPADLPGPEAGVGVAAAPAAARVAPVVQEFVRPALPAHRHRSPGGGIGLAAFGLFLWFVYQLLVELPRVGTVPPIATVSAEAAFLLQFLGFLFLGAGVLIALSSLRDRR